MGVSQNIDHEVLGVWTTGFVAQNYFNVSCIGDQYPLFFDAEFTTVLLSKIYAEGCPLEQPHLSVHCTDFVPRYHSGV